MQQKQTEKDTTGKDTSSFTKKNNLANLISDIDKLDIEKQKKCTY